MTVHAGKPNDAYKRTAMAIDKRGREIVVSRMSAVGVFRLARILGDNERNSTMYNMALIAGCVESIDGSPEPTWTTLDGLERALGRLDLDGIEAASKALASLNDDEAEVIEQAKN